MNTGDCNTDSLSLNHCNGYCTFSRLCNTKDVEFQGTRLAGRQSENVPRAYFKTNFPGDFRGWIMAALARTSQSMAAMLLMRCLKNSYKSWTWTITPKRMLAHLFQGVAWFEWGLCCACYPGGKWCTPWVPQLQLVGSWHQPESSVLPWLAHICGLHTYVSICIKTRWCWSIVSASNALISWSTRSFSTNSSNMWYFPRGLDANQGHGSNHSSRAAEPMADPFQYNVTQLNFGWSNPVRLQRCCSKWMLWSWCIHGNPGGRMV